MVLPVINHMNHMVGHIISYDSYWSVNFSDCYCDHVIKGHGLKRKEKNRGSQNYNLARHQLSIFNYWSRFITMSLTTDNHNRRVLMF